MKLTKQTLCTIVTIIYHLAFLGSASIYVSEFEKTRKLIEEKATIIQHQAKNIERIGYEINSSVNSVGKKLDETKRTCSKLKF